MSKQFDILVIGGGDGLGRDLTAGGQWPLAARSAATAAPDRARVTASSTIATRTAADNDNIFGCFRFDDPECVLLIRLRVHCA